MCIDYIFAYMRYLPKSHVLTYMTDIRFANTLIAIVPVIESPSGKTLKESLYASTISLSSDDDKMSKAVGVEQLKDSSPVMLSSSTTSWILSQTENKTQLTLIIVCVWWIFPNSSINKYGVAICILKRVMIVILIIIF